MHERKFEVKKLVRDKRIEQMESEGALVSYRNLNTEDLDNAIRAKIVEEAQELQSAEDVTGELADLLELVYVLTTLHAISSKDILQTQEEKVDKDGEFISGTYIDSISLPADSPWMDNFASRPEKYPEIILLPEEEN